MPQDTTRITGRTEDGRAATLTLAVDAAPLESAELHTHPGPLAVGTTVRDEDFHLFTTRDKGSAFCRTFSAPGEGLLPWSAPNRKLPLSVADFHSWKDWPSDAGAIALINAQLDTMPARLLEEPPLLPHLRPYDPDGYSDGQRESDGFSALMCWFHEGERNMIETGIPAREWRRRHRLAYKTIRQHRNGHRVGYMSIGTLTWLAAKSDPARGSIKGDYDPFAWWAGVGDYAAIDCYAPSITSGSPAPAMYPSPPAFFELLDQLAAGTGRRAFVPELGVIRQGGSPPDSGSLRANWITNAVLHADRQGYAGVAWWDAPGANARDFRLTDAPSAGAWSAEITRDRTAV